MLQYEFPFNHLNFSLLINFSIIYFRTPSTASTTSSEEVTYTFGGKETPPRYSPSEGYLSYPHESYPESDYSISKRGMPC